MCTYTQCRGQSASAGRPPLHAPPTHIAASHTHIPPGAPRVTVGLHSVEKPKSKIPPCHVTLFWHGKLDIPSAIRT